MVSDEKQYEFVTSRMKDIAENHVVDVTERNSRLFKRRTRGRETQLRRINIFKRSTIGTKGRPLT